MGFDAGQYPAVFDAAMRTLDEWRFVPDRIDAARGVITTYPKRTAGLATPWDREQTGLDDEARDLLHQHEREVRISFDPPETPSSVLVEVAILRVRRPGWRVETDALRFSSYSVDPGLRRRGEQPEYREVIGTDPDLEARLAARIRELAGMNTPAPAATVSSIQQQ